MKIRQGFVSNSSSSSFIIFVKNGELEIEKILKSFKISKKNKFYSLFYAAALTMINNCEEQTENSYLREYAFTNGDFNFLIKNDNWVGHKQVKEAFDKNWKVYTGEISSHIGGLENALCHIEIIYDDKNIFINKDSGY